MSFKPLIFVGSAREDLRNFPAAVRREAGFQLHAVQSGLAPSDFKPMPEVGPGASELRVHMEGEWRVLYVAKFAGGIYVLHCFEKKTRKMPHREMEIARRRYKQAKEHES